MHVTKYHLSRFPPVKQMSGYWSVHAIAQGPRLEFPVALKKASSSLVPGLYPVSARELCWWRLDAVHGGLTAASKTQDPLDFSGKLQRFICTHNTLGRASALSNLFPELFPNPHCTLWCNKCTGGLHYFRNLLAFIQFSTETWLSLHKALDCFYVLYSYLLEI